MAHKSKSSSPITAIIPHDLIVLLDQMRGDKTRSMFIKETLAERLNDLSESSEFTAA